MRKWLIVGMVMSAVLLSPANGQQTQSSNPETLELQRMRRITTHLQASLVDPESARFVLPFGFTPQLSTWRIWGVPETGYFTCGVVNSRNRMGGYAGFAVFIGIIRADGSVETTLDGDSHLLERICEEKRQQGQLPAIDPAVKRAIIE